MKTVIKQGNLLDATGKPTGQQVVCVVYHSATLEILATAGTHNEASEISNKLFCDFRIDSLSDEVRFLPGAVLTSALVGMKMNQFESFITSNTTHPLCRQG